MTNRVNPFDIARTARFKLSNFWLVRTSCPMSSLKAILWPLLVIFIVISPAYSYTRDSRSIEAIFDSGKLKIDLITTSVRHSIENLCATTGCDVNDTTTKIEAWLDLKTFEVVADAFSTLNKQYQHIQPREGLEDWRVDSIDQYVLLNHHAAQKESSYLLAGVLKPRDTCIQSDNAGNVCKFARYVTSYLLKSPVVLKGRIPFDNYVYLFELAEDLFNAQLYDHAEAWCSFLVHHLLPSVETIRQDASFSLAALESNDLILLTRGSLVLSEIARLKGQLDLATHHSMRVVRCYQLLSTRHNVPFFDPKHNVALISRLRILLTIPPTPPDYATAKMHRQHMIEDLIAFLKDVKMHNETISLEVMHTSCLKSSDYLYD